MLSMNFYMIVPFKISFIFLVVSFFPYADPTSAARGRVNYLGSALVKVPEPKSFSFSLVIFRRPDSSPDPKG